MQRAALAGALAGLAGGVLLGWLGATDWAGTSPADGPGAPTEAAAASAFGFGNVEASLARLPPARRAAVLDDAAAFAAFVEQRGQQAVLAAAADSAGLADQAPVQAQLREATTDLLAERYLQREAPATAAVAPDEAAIEAFYRDRQASFRVPDRLPVWQIFVAAPAGDESARSAARQRARATLEALLAGKSTLAALAAETSDHAPSRLNGGFMGLLAPEELKPEVRQALLAAPQGKPVGPVETDEGFHIVQRGELVPGTVPPLDEVRPRIVAWLTEQSLAAQRAAVLRRAAEAHPLNIDAADLEQWRQRLRAAAAAESGLTGAAQK